MVAETSMNKSDQEQNPHSSEVPDHFNSPGMSRTNTYGTQAYQYPSESHNMSSFIPNKTTKAVIETHVQNRAMNNIPPKPSDTTISVGGQWRHPVQTYDNRTMTGSDERQEVQLKLPLPPKPQMHHGMSRHNQRLQNYTFAHVPTAQAEFPVNYDARLGPQGDRNVTDSAEGQETETFSESFDTPDLDGPDSVGSNLKDGAEKDKSMQEKIEENLKKKTDIVIKKLDSNRPAPKFIPRQAQIKKQPSVSSQNEAGKVKNSENNPVNRELKRNAFTLGKPQGPIVPGSELVKQTEKAEESVNKTVKDIRKRMIQVISMKRKQRH